MIATRRDALTGKILEVQLTTLETAVVKAYDKLTTDMGYTQGAALTRLSLRCSLTPNFVRFLTGVSDVKAVAR